MEIINFFRAILELLKEILAELRDRRAGQVVVNKNLDFMEDLIDGVTVMSILLIGKSTLYRIKRSKSVNVVRIGKKDYYSKMEIQALVNKFMK